MRRRRGVFAPFCRVHRGEPASGVKANMKLLLIGGLIDLVRNRLGLRDRLNLKTAFVV